MDKYISYGTIISDKENSRKAKIKELKHFITDYKELELRIEEKFPRSDFGSDEEFLEVGGSQNLIDLFQTIDEKKIDIVEELQNVEYKGISEDKEVLLEFKDNIVLGFKDNIVAKGTYNFTYQFFEVLFDMGKYSKFCINNELTDLLEENMEYLSVKFNDKKNQYRLINKDDEWLLRGITSSRYNNYDNNIAIYLVLLLLSRLSQKEKIGINLKSAYISDSEMRVFFEQDNYVSVKGIGDIYFGILVTNGEIRNSEFSAEIYYRIVDEVDKDLSFTAINDLKDSIFSVNHMTGLDTLVPRVQNISNLLHIEKSMLSYIESIKSLKTISDNTLYSIMLKITQSRMLIAQTRENFKEIYDKNLINNSMSLLQVFNKINQITTDIDERIYIQRIYNEIIKDLSKHS